MWSAVRDTEALPPPQGRERAAVAGAWSDATTSSRATAQAKQTLWPPSVHASAQRWIWADVSRERLDRALYLSGTTDAYTVSTLGSFMCRNLTCFSTPLQGQNSWCGERARHRLNGNGASSCLTHRSSTPAKGSDPSLNRAGMATDHRGSFASNPRPTLSLDSSLTKVVADSTLWGKTWLAPASDLALPSKALSTWGLHQDTPT